ncbi:MAG: bifunctional nuclease family protein [Flavobacteriales bacterium]|nr:bifunctional nuclease family protein [Flavobacteriales bacterium]
MARIQMDIFGLTDRGMSQGAYALILKEADGQRKMPIIIGIHEAQAIASELEGIHAQRPLTHDLMRSVIEGLGAHLKEVVIHSVHDGTFYSSLIFENNNVEIDARPSDAIALAIRCGVPVYVTEEILSQSSDETEDSGTDGSAAFGSLSQSDSDDPHALNPELGRKPARPLTARERLEQELEDAVRLEDYERAAQIRDELNKLHD